MKQKFISVLLFILVLSLVITGCGSSNNGTETKGKDATNSNAEAKDSSNTASDKMLLRIAHPQPVDSPEDVAINTFAEVVREKAGDKIEIEIYPAMQIGSIPEMMESTQMGVVEMCMANTAILSSFCEDMRLMDLPYLLPKDPEVIDKVLNKSDVGAEFLERVQASNFEGLGFWFLGHRMMSTTDREVHSPEDMKGLKMRIMESPILTDIYNSWGASAIPIPYAELYNSLQQGVVDGQENPVQSIYLNNLHEVQDYVFSTYHGTQTYVLVANKPWFDNLDGELQGVIREAELAGREKLIEILPEYQEEYLKGIIDSGTNYYELTDEEIAKFAEASRVVYDKFLVTDWQKEYFPRLEKAFKDAMAN